MFGRATITLGIGPHSSFSCSVSEWKVLHVDVCSSTVKGICHLSGNLMVDKSGYPETSASVDVILDFNST